MKKRILSIIAVVALILAFAGCGSDDDTASSENNGANTETSTDSESSGSDTGNRTDIAQISQSEIEGLSDNQFYAANLTGVDITELYVAETGSGDWGNNLISSPITDGQKVIVSASGIETGKEYDICVIDSDDNTTEYYNFDIISTVQVTFYENAQCDVSTI